MIWTLGILLLLLTPNLTPKTIDNDLLWHTSVDSQAYSQAPIFT